MGKSVSYPQSASVEFKYHLLKDLPRLAWGAEITRNQAVIEVFHGPCVEVRADAFIEGAWNGDYDAFDPIGSTVVCGSGGVIRNGLLTFFASTENIQGVFSIAKGNRLYISNSPVFAMVLAGERPDPAYPFYHLHWIRFARNGFSSDQMLPTESGVPLRGHFGLILEVATDLQVSGRHFPLHRDIDSYQTYREILASAVASILENASSPHRHFSYGSVVACSKGYDSNAATVFARAAGTTDAFTFTDSRIDDPMADSGADVADRLGLRCTSIDRWEHTRSAHDYFEVALPTCALGLQNLGAEDLFEQKVSISGHHGDIIWGMEFSGHCEDGKTSFQHIASGHGMVEYRLRAGFIELAPARIAARHSNAIHRIMHSEEMKEWSVGGGYDRPIPRRILEEAGVPREMFGMKKMASAHASFNKEKHWPVEARESYATFLAARALEVGRAKNGIEWLRHGAKNFSCSLLHNGKDHVVPVSYWQNRLPFFLNRHTPIRWEFSFVYQWACEQMRPRYEVPLKRIRA